MQITIDGKPLQTQIKDWYENGIVIFCKEKNGSIHNGKIIRYEPFDSDDALWRCCINKKTVDIFPISHRLSYFN